MNRRLCMAALGLLFSQYQIDYPAPARVVPRLAAVVQNVGIRASGFFHGVGKDWEVRESALSVNGLCQRLHRWGKTGGIEGIGPELIADDATEKNCQLLAIYPAMVYDSG